MKNIYFIAFGLFSVVFLSKALMAQELKFCGQTHAQERIKSKNPKLYDQVLETAKELEEFTAKYALQKSNERGTVYVIPVVFHIIHNNGIENISNEQVYDAVRVLNEDFRKLNADTSDIVQAFKAIAGDSEIEFRMAQKDPQGNCTNGITRTASMETYLGEMPSTSDVSRWPRENYLNVWVVNSISFGAAGYTNYPSTLHWYPEEDGIMILHSYVGSIGTGNYVRSRAMTHEVGHWINLMHTWGDSNDPEMASNCNDDDNVADTPNTMGWTYCNLTGNSCSSLDNVQNYMDYSYCHKMFTQGQATRMRAALTSTIAQRYNLWQPENLILTGTDSNLLCKADFSVSKTEICVGETVNFKDLSYNEPSSWNWSFPGATLTTSSDRNPVVTYNIPGIYDVNLIVSDGVSTISENRNGYIAVLQTSGLALPFVEGFESFTSLLENNWFVNNPDQDQSWEVTNTGATGLKSIRINNFNNPIGAVDEISSTTIDLSSFVKVNISFKVAYAKKNASVTTDELKLFVSSNCGTIWVQRWSQSASLATAPAQASAFTPTDSSQWMKYTISTLPLAYMNSNFRFKFQFKNGGGNNIYIDDINISDYSVGINEQDKYISDFRVIPNPFNEDAVIAFSLSEIETVKLTVIDMLGKESVIQPASVLPSGQYNLKLNKAELDLSRGIYFIKLMLGDTIIIRKIILN